MKRGTANTGTPFFSCRQLLRHPFSEIRFLVRARTLCVQSVAPMTPLQWLIAFAGCLAVVVFACTARSVDARILEASKKAGEYEVTIQIDKNPPIIGANNIEVEIKDSGGRIQKAKGSCSVDYEWQFLGHKWAVRGNSDNFLIGLTHRALKPLRGLPEGGKAAAKFDRAVKYGGRAG